MTDGAQRVPLTPAMRASLLRGLAQSARGETVDLGDFAEFAEE